MGHPHPPLVDGVVNAAIELCRSIIDQATDAMLRMPSGAERDFFHGGKSAARTIMMELQRAPETPPTAPIPSEVGPEVVERMIALVRRMGDAYRSASTPGELPSRNQDMRDYQEARDIQRGLPETVDADEQYARDLIREQGWLGVGEIGGQAVLRMITTAHRAGRALAAGDRS